VSESPARRVAIVFGAGLRRDGTPTAILRDRVETAADLYRSGKVEKILMSGDNRFENYNEPESMRQYALSLGVPPEAIAMDYAGRRTYDTCYRAKPSLASSALLVSQRSPPAAPVPVQNAWFGSSRVEANQRSYRDRLCWSGTA
jgi:SanA protein